MIGQNINDEVAKWEYLSHWVSFDELAAQCTPKKPLKKLKKFNPDMFSKRHESSINRIYFQKMILVAVAAELQYKLYISKNFYETNGLVYGLYRFHIPGASYKHITGIEMVEEVNSEMQFKQKFKWFEEILEQMKFLIKKNNFFTSQQSEQGEYHFWMKGIIDFTQNKPNFSPYQFLTASYCLPLTEHYIFKIKWENAMLLPIFVQNEEMVQFYRETIEAEKQIIQTIFKNEYEDMNENIQSLKNLDDKIFMTLYENEKIGLADDGPPFFKEMNKMKYKESCPIISRKFAIILSRFRGVTVTNSTDTNTTELKDSKNCTKIQIKACNGLIEPISGNVIFVKLGWTISSSEQQIKLILQCCNNRKVQEMHYEEVYTFWEKLENNQKFRDLVGVDKYMISLNEDPENLEVIISNYIPACLITNSLKEIDKIVTLALVLDEVIEICERKDNDKEDSRNFNIEPYMIDHAIMRFERAMGEIERRCEKIYDSVSQCIQ